MGAICQRLTPANDEQTILLPCFARTSPQVRIALFTVLRCVSLMQVRSMPIVSKQAPAETCVRADQRPNVVASLTLMMKNRHYTRDNFLDLAALPSW